MNSSKNNKRGGYYWNQPAPCTEEEVGRLMLENIKLLLQKKESDVEPKNGDDGRQQQAPTRTSSQQQQSASAPPESPRQQQQSASAPPESPSQQQQQQQQRQQLIALRLQQDKSGYNETLKSVLEEIPSLPDMQPTKPTEQQKQIIKKIINLLTEPDLPDTFNDNVLTDIQGLRGTFLQ